MLKDPLKPSSVLCGARETIQKMDEHCVICAFECFVPLHRLALVARVRGRQKIGLFELNEHSKLTRDVAKCEQILGPADQRRSSR